MRPRRIGLLAGWGRYPAADRRGPAGGRATRSTAWASPGMADPQLAEVCDDFQWVGLARFGAAIRYFQRHGVTEAIMAGKIHKVLLFQPWRWLQHVPDLRTIRMFVPHFLTRQKDCKDDTLLGAIVEEFAAEGIRFGPATDYAPELLVGAGQLTRRGPSPWQWKDIRFGWQMAKEMGRLDIGQSVAVSDQAVMAVEAVEGTDECIRRAGELCRGGRIHRGQSGQAAAGHAFRRAHRRPENAETLLPPAAGCWRSKPAAPSSSTPRR